MTVEELKAQVDEALADAAIAHPWLMSVMDGHALPASQLDATEILTGLVALSGSLIDSVNLITKFLGQDASRRSQ